MSVTETHRSLYFSQSYSILSCAYKQHSIGTGSSVFAKILSLLAKPDACDMIHTAICTDNMYMPEL